MPSHLDADGANVASCNSNRVFWEYGRQQIRKSILANVGKSWLCLQ
jgi:hypothetical protein